MEKVRDCVWRVRRRKVDIVAVGGRLCDAFDFVKKGFIRRGYVALELCLRIEGSLWSCAIW
jgi:hypothetical protein